MTCHCRPSYVLIAPAMVLIGAVMHGGEPEAAEGSPVRTVYVAVNRAQVHSGPSTEYYPTGLLERGTMLDVYHQAQDDWLGIRPPEGSFSWVAATDAYLLPGGRIIEITTDSAVSWIGTALGSAKQYRWQVQLDRGEQLAVLGEQTRRGEDGREMLWYKIAAPAGEFRWIHRTAVSDRPVQVAAATEAQPDVTGGVSRAPVDPEAAKGSSSEGAVAPANYQSAVADDVFGPGPTEVYYDEPGFAEQVVEAVPAYGGEVVMSGRRDPFAGWHAMELGDDGMRITLFDKLLGSGSPPRHDPLAQDPFSLSMAGRAVPQPSAVQTYAADATRTKAVRAWRDPRTLSRPSAFRSRTATSGSTFSAASREDGEVQQPWDDQLAEGRSSDETRAGNSPIRLTGSRNSSLVTQRQSSRSNADFAVDPQGTNWYGIGSATEVGRSDFPTRDSNLLSQLQVALSEVVAGPMQSWNLQPLYEQASLQVEEGNSPIARGQARLLLERIEEFAELARKSGYVALNPGVSQASAASSANRQPMRADSARITEDVQRAASGLPSYDATGWLVPVLAAERGQPSHALTNESGQILVYVTALPGMNLDRYLNQTVGILGLRGYLPQLQAAHIQAERVVRLP